jgi:hypothetical protein
MQISYANFKFVSVDLSLTGGELLFAGINLLVCDCKNLFGNYIFVENALNRWK